MREGDEKLELAAGKCASLAAKRHRLLTGVRSLEKSDTAFSSPPIFARAQADERWWTGVNQQLEAREPINAVGASSFLASPLYFQEFLATLPSDATCVDAKRPWFTQNSFRTSRFDRGDLLSFIDQLESHVEQFGDCLFDRDETRAR